MNETALEEIEISINTAKDILSKGSALDNLLKNKDFEKVILKGYFEQEASRLVLLKADPNLQKIEDQNSIDKQILAISYFRQYLFTIMQLSKMAKRDLYESELTKEELLQESN